MATPHEEDDGYSSISGPTLEKACKELGENPSTRGQVVKDFREMIMRKQAEINVRDILFVMGCINNIRMKRLLKAVLGFHPKLNVSL